MKQPNFIANWDPEMRLKLNPGMYSTLCRINVIKNMKVPLMFA